MESSTRFDIENSQPHFTNCAATDSLKRHRPTYQPPSKFHHLPGHSKLPHPRHLLKYVSSLAYTLLLFTYSDLKTIFLPTIVFALLNAPVFSPQVSATPAWLFRRTLQTALWTWINLLLFCLHNQRLPAAVREDKVNKPWRPLPSQRLSPQGASYILLAGYPLAYLVSAKIGGLAECMVLTILNYWYNDAGGANQNFLIRNLINACGFVCYAAGALKIAVGTTAKTGAEESNPQHAVVQWLSIVGLVIFSTIQAQDLRDRVGDRLQQRQTLPVVLGDWKSRWAVVVPIAVWSLLCPRFWQVGVVGYAAVAVFGLVIGARTLTKRRVEDDRLTFKVWSFWIISIYALPLIKKMDLL